MEARKNDSNLSGQSSGGHHTILLNIANLRVGTEESKSEGVAFGGEAIEQVAAPVGVGDRLAWSELREERGEEAGLVHAVLKNDDIGLGGVGCRGGSGDNEGRSKKSGGGGEPVEVHGGR